jgi:hypothetical protein
MMAVHWLAALFAAVLVGAVVAHELTHALVAAVVAERVRVDWRGLETVADYPATGVRWRSYAVAVAPLVVGVVAGVGALALAGVPDTIVEYIYTVGWGAYAVGGGVDEYRFHDDEPISHRAD